MRRSRWHPGTIGEAVLEELGRLGPGGGMADVVAAWPAAVGAAIAENAWPSRVARDGTLLVTTASSVWSYELTKLEATVRGRLVEVLGAKAPARLRFAVGPLPERTAPEPVTNARRTVPEVRADDRREAELIAAPIENAELRALVAKAVAASLARAGARPDGRALW